MLSSRTRDFGTLGLLLLGESVALSALLVLQRHQWIPAPAEILSTTPEMAIYGLAWIVALAATSWIALTTVASVVARVVHAQRGIRAIDWMTLPSIRRLAQRITALSVVASSLAAPNTALASEPPPIPVVVTDEVAEESLPTIPGPVWSPPIIPRLVPPPSSSPTPSVTPPSEDGRTTSIVAVAQEASPQRYTVRPGDNMWTITADYLAEVLAAKPSTNHVSRVWRVVMDLNRGSIRSGNVDLIFPGEVLILPPISANG